MPTAEQFAAAGGATSTWFGGNAVLAYMLAWAPPEDVAGLLEARGTRDRVERWLSDWFDEINRSQSVRRALSAAAQIGTKTRTWTAEWNGREDDVSWRYARVPTARGGMDVYDLGNTANLEKTFKTAVKAGRPRGLGGEYAPGNWEEANVWADNLAANWTAGAVYVANFATTTLRAAADWYAGQKARDTGRAQEQQQTAAQAALEREQDRQAAAAETAEAERVASRPERMAKLKRAAAAIFGGDGRTAGKLRAKAEALGPLRARFALGLAADAVEAAEAAGADEATAIAAGEAAAAQALGLWDALYPLAEPDFYAATFGTLPGPWALLWLGIAYADDPASADLPLAAAGYYTATLPDLLPEWQNLFVNYSLQISQPTEGA